MKLSEFILLNEGDKKCAVMNNAVTLAQRIYPDVIIFLFQLDCFYIEAYCNKGNKAIEEYRVLPDTNAIRHYLEAIPIDDLINWLAFMLCNAQPGFLNRGRALLLSFENVKKKYYLYIVNLSFALVSLIKLPSYLHYS